jgi:5,10-methylenetetrahydromethanopterin reductase
MMHASCAIVAHDARIKRTGRSAISVTAEVWTTGIAWPGVVERAAARAEAAGFDGLAVVDSQNLAGDPWVGLALAARETERLRLGTAVTNPVTRHPAVTAAAAVTLQAASADRFVLGIGRGDSALAHLGRAPAPVAAFERCLAVLQAYLRGDDVAFDDLGFHEAVAPPVDSLGLAKAPAASRLHFLPTGVPKVPVEVSATGPRVLSVAARHADRVMLALGADPQRVRWGIETARASGAVSVGSFVNVVAHPDVTAARELASGGVATFARFSVMHGTVSGPIDPDERDTLTAIHDAYDMTRHTQVGSPQAGILTPDFIDRFAVVGTPETCTRRLHQLVALGLDKLIVTGPTLGADPGEARAALERFASEVLPALPR